MIPGVSSRSGIAKRIKELYLVSKGSFKDLSQILSFNINSKPFMSKQHTKTKTSSEIDKLTPRQKEVLRLAGKGLSYRQIANELYNSPETIRTHFRNIYKKLQVNNKLEAIRKIKP